MIYHRRRDVQATGALLQGLARLLWWLARRARTFCHGLLNGTPKW